MRVACCCLVIFCGNLLAGCGLSRLYPPIAFIERVAPIYPDARPHNCKLAVLTTPPAEPYEIFAQVVSYAGSADMVEKMQTLIKENACEAGADAIVLLPVQQGTHINTVDIYPDWVLEGTERLPHWTDKRYSVSQRAIAVVFKRGPAVEPKKSGS